MRARHAVVAILATLLFAGCAKDRYFNLQDVDTALTPAQAAARAEVAKGHKVQWGGVIVSSRNLQDATQLEVLAYPLDRSGRPDTGAMPLGRFLALDKGYLETVDYAPGREVTVVGPFTGVRAGKVGEAQYTYPVVSIEQLRLWPRERPQASPRVNFGIGIGVYRGF